MLLRPILDSLSAPQPAGDLPDVRTAGQRRHDAVAELGTRLLASGSIPDTAGCPVTVLVSVTAEDLVAAQRGLGALATDSYGTPISLGTIARLTAEIEFTAVTLNSTGGILDFGRRRRLASPSQRRALTVRDKGCAFPGCTRHASWTEVHHITQWLAGGATDLNNLVLLCRYHHRHFEAAGWAVRMRLDGVPEWIPPKWLDEDQHPRRNTAHDALALPAPDCS